jgi:hypothetical protein
MPNPNPPKFQVGDYITYGRQPAPGQRSKRIISKVIATWFKRPRGKHTYYSVNDGSMIRADRAKRFEGVVLNTQGAVVREGDPKHGFLIVTKGKWRYFSYFGRGDKLALRAYPKVKEYIDKL